MINECQYWVKDGCSEGLYGGKPSLGVCKNCKTYKDSGQPRVRLSVRSKPMFTIPDDYDPNTSPQSPKHGSCCDKPKLINQ